MKRTFYGAMTGLLMLAMSGLPFPSYAQSSYTLSFRDGNVYIDGQEVPADELPASLKLKDLSGNLSFSGDTTPILEFGGAFYMLDGQRLREVKWDEGADGVTIFFREKTEDGPVVLRKYRRDDPGVMFFSLDGDASHMTLVQDYTQRLHARAVELQALSQDDRIQDAKEITVLVRQLTEQAEETARVAEQLPQLEVESYLFDVQRRDNTLYQQLRNEQHMELETHQLAARIRALQEGAERTALMKELEARLNEIFDLKQRNRRQEIEQLEARLEELYRRLEEREDMRQRVIERRIGELLYPDRQRD
jgi:hypothetical protein